MIKTTITPLAAFASVTSANFSLDYPAARGLDEDNLGKFPCGGQDTVSTNRTVWLMSGGEIALTMGHIDANVEVLIGFSDDVGSSFNTVLRSTFTEQGLGAFCMTVINGDRDGGLYNCADITFSSTAPATATGICNNGTGVILPRQQLESNVQPHLTTTASSLTTTKSAGIKIMNAGLGSFGYG